MNQQFNDPLVQCLIALGRHHGSSTTAEALVSGLPLADGLLTPRLFPRAAERLGLAANLIQRQPRAIARALLPDVILNDQSQSCLYQCSPGCAECLQ
jgi:ATP-binding cassette subfamily C protein LapB